VLYEELAADYDSKISRVLNLLHVGSEQAIIPLPRIRKQSDALSLEWEERYHKLSAEPEI
jgi:LPS sulfotransferase NodH